MTSFEYASGLISIVVGLAIARVLGGVGAFLSADQRTARDWIVGAWCMTLTLNLVAWWMTGWQFLRQHTEISLATLFFWTLATALLYLAAYILVPGTVEGHSRHEPKTDFDLPNPAFFACLAAHFALFFLYRVTGSNQAESPGLDSQFPVQILALVVLAAAGIWLKTPRSYTIHLFVWLVTLVAMTTTGLPALS